MNAIAKILTKPFRVLHWSIGIYEGTSIDDLKPHENNPVLTKDDVTDCLAGFLADPFLFQRNGKYYLFFEVMNVRTGLGEIGCAVSSDKYNWNYLGLVIREKFHLSYPFIFSWKNCIFMVPESYQKKAVRLYKSINFPFQWKYECDLLIGDSYTDSTIFQYSGNWWMFTFVLDFVNKIDISRLELWYSRELKKGWKKHPANPISYGHTKPSRPAGRIIEEDRIIRFAQNTTNYYGQELYKFEINKIDENVFEQHLTSEKPFFSGTGMGWNAKGMHQVDILKTDEKNFLACADGLSDTTIKNPKVIFHKLKNKIF